MSISRQNGTLKTTSLRDVAVIRSMIADLRRSITILNCDIAAEEQRAEMVDAADPRYPMLARTLGARRDNLKVTIAVLERRLATLEPIAREAAAQKASVRRYPAQTLQRVAGALGMELTQA
jgi:hypothetical protein